MSLHGFRYQAQNFRLGGSTPDAEGKASTRTKNTIGFRCSLSGAGKVQHAERACYGVKTIVGIAEVLGVCDLELHPGETASRFGNHILRNVGTSYIQLATRRFSRDIPGPTRHVEQLDAGPGIRRGKESIDSLTRHFADERIVVLGLLAPTGSLEIFEGLALLLVDRHYIPRWYGNGINRRRRSGRAAFRTAIDYFERTREKRRRCSVRQQTGSRRRSRPMSATSRRASMIRPTSMLKAHERSSGKRIPSSGRAALARRSPRLSSSM